MIIADFGSRFVVFGELAEWLDHRALSKTRTYGFSLEAGCLLFLTKRRCTRNGSTHGVDPGFRWMDFVPQWQSKQRAFRGSGLLPLQEDDSLRFLNDCTLIMVNFDVGGYLGRTWREGWIGARLAGRPADTAKTPSGRSATTRTMGNWSSGMI